jgi:hypothetical protein
MISVGDTVEVRSPSAGRWTGEVVSWVSSTGETNRARIRCITPPAGTGHGIQAGQTTVVPLATLLPLTPPVAEAMSAGPPDPVEIVAWILSDHRTAYNDPGPAGVCEDDRTAARRVLAALVSGPWHLVTFGPGRDGIGAHVPTAEIAQEWTP